MSNSGVPSVTIEELKKWDSTSDVVVVDVREKDEWDEGHIEGAIHIPLTTFADDFEHVLPDKEAHLLIYCHSGGRSSTATQLLRENGYTKAFNVEGGYEAYSK